MSFLERWLPARSSLPASSGEALARPSHAVAQFFEFLAGRQHPSVLDLGPVWHSTVTLLTEAGAKVYTEDVWQVLPALAGKQDENEPEPPSAAARRFLEANLRYPEQLLDAILAWDLFEYLPEALLQPTRARLHAVLKPGGLVLAIFRNRMEPAVPKRYRLVTRRAFAPMPTEPGMAPQRVLQNRAILDLFAGFSTSRTFIGRDNLREVLFVK